MPWSLVSPASRGIGFHLTRHLLQTTKIPVVATARKDIEEVKKSLLQDLPDVDSDRLTVLELDFTSNLPLCPSPYPSPSKISAQLIPHRRKQHPARSRRRKIYVQHGQPPAPHLRHSGDFIPGKVPLATRPRSANSHLRDQHHRPPAPHEALHTLPTYKSHQTPQRTRTWIAALRRLAHDVRPCRLHHG